MMANFLMNGVGRVSCLHQRLLLALLISTGAFAQTASPGSSAAAPTSASAATPSDAVQRQALGPYRMILRSSTVPARAKTLPATTASPPVAVSAPREKANRQPQEASVAVSPLPEMPAAAVASVEPVAVAVAAPTSPTPAATAVAARTALILIKNEPPVLSGALARESPSGVVRVAFNVKPDGSTSDFRIAASNNRRLNAAVIAAVTQWTYQPVDVAQAAEVEMVFRPD